MSSQTIYLITGAGRGLGLAISQIILARPNVTLIAYVRDPSSQQDLDSITPGTNSSILKIKYDASDPSSASEATSLLQSTHGINHIDVVIANAGGITYMGPSRSASPDYFLKDFSLNTLGPITLFQALLPLLLQSAQEDSPTPKAPLPKFFAISSQIGSTSMIAANPQVSALPYGVSKAGLNHAMVKFHGEYPNIIVGLLTPGRTKTGFARDAVRNMGARNTALSFHTAEESAEGLVRRIDGATREGDGGRFWDWSEGEISW